MRRRYCTVIMTHYTSASKEIMKALSEKAMSRTRLESRVSGKSARGKARAQPPPPEIAKLDREIDQIVYKLYGLSPDEIRIVEGQR